MKTVFVTGAGGYIGGRLLIYLRDRGCDVVAGVRNRSRKLAYEKAGIRALVCNVADAINVARAVASIRPDGVVHLAGVSTPRDAQLDPLAAFQDVVCGWANVLDAVRRASPRARVVAVSSYEVYPGTTGDRLLREDSDADPTSVLGALKLQAEQLARSYYREFRTDVTIARPFCVVGPRQPAKFPFASYLEIIAASAGGAVEVPNMDDRLDVVHADDAVAALERLLADGKPDTVYNICGGQSVPNRELLAALVAERGLGVELRPSSASGRGGPASFRGDPSRMQADTGWSVGRSALDALRDLWTSRESAAVGAVVAAGS